MNIEEKYPLVINANSSQFLLEHELVGCFTEFEKLFIHKITP